MLPATTRPGTGARRSQAETIPCCPCATSCCLPAATYDQAHGQATQRQAWKGWQGQAQGLSRDFTIDECARK